MVEIQIEGGSREVEMSKLCLICYQEVTEGLRVPRYKEDPDEFVHRQCLWIKLAEICQGGEYEGKLRYLVEYEEKAKKDAYQYSDNTADVIWQREQVKLNTWEIRKLLENRIISVVLGGRNKAVQIYKSP